MGAREDAVELLEQFAPYALRGDPERRLKFVDSLARAGEDPRQRVHGLLCADAGAASGHITPIAQLMSELRARSGEVEVDEALIARKAELAMKQAESDRRPLDAAGFARLVSDAWSALLIDPEVRDRLGPTLGLAGREIDPLRTIETSLLIDFNLPAVARSVVADSVLADYDGGTYEAGRDEALSFVDTIGRLAEPDEDVELAVTHKMLVHQWIGELEARIEFVRNEMKRDVPGMVRSLDRVKAKNRRKPQTEEEKKKDESMRAFRAASSKERRKRLVACGLVRGRFFADLTKFVAREHVAPPGAYVGRPPAISAGTAARLTTAERRVRIGERSDELDAELIALRRSAREEASGPRLSDEPFIDERAVNESGEATVGKDRVILCPQDLSQYWRIDATSLSLYAEIIRDTGDQKRVKAMKRGALMNESAHGEWIYLPGGGVGLQS